jgi:hypothetical protein
MCIYFNSIAMQINVNLCILVVFPMYFDGVFLNLSHFNIFQSISVNHSIFKGAKINFSGILMVFQ